MVGLNVIANHLDSFKRTVGPGAPAIDYAGFTGGYYKWKTYTNLSYQVGPALAGLRWRYLSSAEAQDYLVTPCTSRALLRRHSVLPSLRLLFDLAGERDAAGSRRHR